MQKFIFIIKHFLYINLELSQKDKNLDKISYKRFKKIVLISLII